jgi:transcriptional regulator with XRE-family HTH domain
MTEEMSWLEGHLLIASAGTEEHFARRIADERLRRRWTQARLAEEMARIGCPVPQTAISRIENPQQGPRRAVSVDEAIGFSKVFDIPLGEMMLPAAKGKEAEALRLLKEAQVQWAQKSEATARYQEVVHRAAMAALESDQFLDGLRAEAARGYTAQKAMTSERRVRGLRAERLGVLDDVLNEAYRVRNVSARSGNSARRIRDWAAPTTDLLSDTIKRIARRKTDDADDGVEPLAEVEQLRVAIVRVLARTGQVADEHALIAAAEQLRTAILSVPQSKIKASDTSREGPCDVTATESATTSSHQPRK